MQFPHRPSGLGLVALSALLISTSLASAASYHVGDTYSGGTNTFNVGNPSNGDVIANDVSGPSFPNQSAFQIFSMDITRTGNNLSVTINTNYVNHIGFLSTGLGALFIGQGSPAFNLNQGTTPGVGTNIGLASNNYAYDTFRNDPGRFDYAVQIDAGITPAGTSGSATLYALDGTLADVQQSWSGNTSTINGSNFRAGQAVGVKSSADVVSTTAAQWSRTSGVDGVDGAGGGQLTFDITNFFGLIPSLNDTELTLAWAMTCGNDVILATLAIPPEAPPPGETPIPGALPLFATGLGALGLVGYRRKRNAQAA